MKASLSLIALLRDENGAAAIEYGLISSLVGVATIGGLQEVGQNLKHVFEQIGQAL